MLRHILKKMHFNKLKNESDRKNSMRENKKHVQISSSLDQNAERLRAIFCDSDDIIFCEFNFGQNKKKRGLLVYIDGVANQDILQKNVIEPLMDNMAGEEYKDYKSIEMLKKNLIPASDTLTVDTLDGLLGNVMSGGTILLVDGLKEALVINAIKWEHRAISEPETENVVRGPREGYTENLKTNITLLRHKIKNPNFCIEYLTIGENTKTSVCIAYIKNIADSGLVEEVRARLRKIQVDSVLDSGYIEQFIEDKSSAIYMTISSSEKPDNTAGKVLEGRVAILVDGSPFVLTVPMLFIESFQVTEDYYSRTIFSSFVRLIRFLSYMASILLPAIYVALTVFHQELIPTQLLISIASGRETVPFPAVIEAAIMIVTFDILREAGVRLPKTIGSAVSIVGALVLGQSAVTAGLISPIMVIVVAATAIASFVVPSQADSSTILRYIYLILAGLAGGFGIIMGLLVNLVYITTLRSFGKPYFSPIAPLVPGDLQDTFIRMPLGRLLKKSQAQPKAGKDADNMNESAGKC